MSQPRSFGISRDFRLFWTGDGVSFLGSQITEVALPLAAVVMLGASAPEMGLLAAATTLPFLLIGLPAGVWVDRVRRKPVLIACDLFAAVGICSVPLSWLLGTLHFYQLAVAALMVGFARVFRSVAAFAYLNHLVPRERILEANARLETTRSMSMIVGPGIGGMLVHGLGAPLALLADGCSYLVSAVTTSLVRKHEPEPVQTMERRKLRVEIIEGLQGVRSSPVIAAIAAYATVHSFFARMLEAVFVLFVVRDLQLSPTELGLVIAAAGPGSLLGSMLAGSAVRAFGAGRAYFVLQILTGVSRIMIPLALLLPWGVVPWLIGSSFLWGLVRTAININHRALIAQTTPEHLYGRVWATLMFLIWGVTPFGAVAGGYLADSIGMMATLMLASIGVFVAAIPLLIPQLRSIKD